MTVEYSNSTAPLVLNYYAAKYKIDFDEFLSVAECESKLRADAIGDHGTSFGVFQIHLPAHPDISKSQALDPWFAADWAAREFSKGRQWEWSCWKSLYGGTSPPTINS